jgi:hypothetical protein
MIILLFCLQSVEGAQLFIELQEDRKTLIDRFAVNITSRYGPTSERQTYVGIFGHAEVDLSVAIECDFLSGEFCNETSTTTPAAATAITPATSNDIQRTQARDLTTPATSNDVQGTQATDLTTPKDEGTKATKMKDVTPRVTAEANLEGEDSSGNPIVIPVSVSAVCSLLIVSALIVVVVCVCSRSNRKASHDIVAQYDVRTGNTVLSTGNHQSGNYNNMASVSPCNNAMITRYDFFSCHLGV